MVKLTPGALLNLLKQTPKTNPPSGAISQIPSKQELERAALRDLELFKMNKGRDPTPEETKLILDNNLGALGFVNIGDLVNRGALKDIYRSPGLMGEGYADELGQVGRPTPKTLSREGTTKSTSLIDTGDIELNDFANSLRLDPNSSAGGLADTIKSILYDRGFYESEVYADVITNRKGERMGYRNSDEYKEAILEYDNFDEMLNPQVRIRMPEYNKVVDYFKQTAKNYLDDKGLGDKIYLFRQGRLDKGEIKQDPDPKEPLSFSLSPEHKSNIINVNQRVDVYFIDKNDVQALPNLHKRGGSDYASEEEVLAAGEDVAYVGSIGDYSFESGVKIKDVDSDNPYIYKDKQGNTIEELSKKAKVNSEQFLNQLEKIKGDK